MYPGATSHHHLSSLPRQGAQAALGMQQQQEVPQSSSRRQLQACL
jgi:hypothetical protein